MTRRSAIALLAAVVLAFVVGLGGLFRLRLASGDIYPAYSSFRADPLGTRALYEALGELPAMRLDRWLKPLSGLPADSSRTLILAGMTREQWDRMSEQDALALDSAAIAGSRIVLVFAAELEPETTEVPTKFEREQKARRDKSEAKRIAELPARLKPADWKSRWNVELRHRRILDRDLAAKRQTGAPVALPLTVAWKSDLYFLGESATGWSTIYTRGSSPVVVERLRGRGSIVLASDDFFLSNEAMAEGRSPALLSWIVGANHRVTFVESQLGLVEDVGVAALARRYGLASCFFVLVLAFALWVWKRMALFVPPAPVPIQLSLSYHQTAGLEALLRRAVSPKQLVATCVGEWRATARPGELHAAESALRDIGADASPVDGYNAATRALKKRR